MTLCWMAAGVAMFGFSPDRNRVYGSVVGGTDRIVSMAPNLTEILFAVGIGQKVVAVSNDSDYPPEAGGRNKVGSFWQPNIEAVIAAKPDLVITLGFGQQRNLAHRLNRIGYNTLTVNMEKVGDLFDAIGKIGEATGAELQAGTLVADIKNRLNNLSTLVGAKDRVRVLYVVQREPLRAAGRDTFINEIIELAGGENAIGPTVYKYPPVGAEQVIACRPEVIIEPVMGQEDLVGQQTKAIQYWSKFENLPAVRNRRIYVINGDAVSRLGPRLYEGTETIARCLRPELFAN